MMDYLTQAGLQSLQTDRNECKPVNDGKTHSKITNTVLCFGKWGQTHSKYVYFVINKEIKTF